LHPATEGRRTEQMRRYQGRLSISSTVAEISVILNGFVR